jgi:hypothetical protein
MRLVELWVWPWFPTNKEHFRCTGTISDLTTCNWRVQVLVVIYLKSVLDQGSACYLVLLSTNVQWWWWVWCNGLY